MQRAPERNPVTDAVKMIEPRRTVVDYIRGQQAHFFTLPLALVKFLLHLRAQDSKACAK
jgi:hypothetical protein